MSSMNKWFRTKKFRSSSRNNQGFNHISESTLAFASVLLFNNVGATLVVARNTAQQNRKS